MNLNTLPSGKEEIKVEPFSRPRAWFTL